MDTHSVTTAYKSGMSFESRIGTHSVLMDVGPADGGDDTAPSPKKLMLASLAGCTGVDIVTILNKMKVQFTGFQVDIEARLSEEHPRIYDLVKLDYRIAVAVEDRSKMEKALALSLDKYCGVMAMFQKFAQVETRITYL